MRKVLSLVIGVSIGVGLFLGYMWYAYVTDAASPYDELGVELNGLVPRRLNDWGCARLMARFPQATPPDGCAGPDGGWRPGTESGR